ncbi:hypothetical protein chiPu_0025490, partial [Chiloscyllium punctatum]|nr:hypothetical protein [Chiloscyllium punctatum]
MGHSLQSSTGLVARQHWVQFPGGSNPVCIQYQAQFPERTRPSIHPYRYWAQYPDPTESCLQVAPGSVARQCRAQSPDCTGASVQTAATTVSWPHRVQPPG